MRPVIDGQRGQALVGVMVVMVILFAAAGAVALAASTLLVGPGQSQAANDDFQVRSAVGDTVSQVAGSRTQCWAPLAVSPSPPPPSPTASPTATPLRLSLPGGAGPQAFCAREDAVVPGSVQRFDGSGGCATVDLGQRTGRLAVLFDARATGSGWAYVDGSAPTTCVTLPDFDDLPLTCWQAVPKASIVQVALTCDFKTSTRVRLHVGIPGTGPGSVFAATQDTSASPSSVGSLYLFASGTGVASPDYEESVMFVSASANRLLYEARLP